MIAWGPAPIVEFEVLVGRCARTGRVHLPELLDLYALSVADSRPALADAQRLDLDALGQSIAALPHALHTADVVRLVPDLHGFAHTPVPAGLGRAGRLSDGSIAWEVKDGPAGLLTRVALLCAVGHESRKAQRLRAALAEEPQDPTFWALALGHDEAQMTAALAQTRGELMAWLFREAPPAIYVHPGLSPQRWAERGSRSAERVVHALAEAGHLGRPLHLWVGPAAITSCLSPYTRELRPALVRWAHAQTQPAAWQPVGDKPSEDTLYAVAQDFLRCDPRLLAEKRQAERTVGIASHVFDGLACDIIDTSRLELPLCDARLAPLRGDAWSQPPPVMVRIDSAGRGLEAICLDQLLRDLGQYVRSVTVMTDGHVPPRADCAAFSVQALWPAGAATPVTFGKRPALVDGLVSGTLVSTPCTLSESAWGSKDVWTRTAHMLGVSVGSAGLAAVVWQASQTTAWDVGWWHVRRDGRAQAQHAALAVARLRQLWWGPARHTQAVTPTPAPAPQETPNKRGSAAWTMRIKA